MTAKEISRLSDLDGTEVIVRSKDGFTYKGTWASYVDRGGGNCGIVIIVEEGGVRECVEILFSKIKSLKQQK